MTPGGTDGSMTAALVVYATVDQVCQVLTDFKALSNVVPNLVECKQLPSPRQGVTRLRQTARVTMPLWRLEASAVLDVSVRRLPLGAREIRFDLQKGDFTRLSGRWLIEPDESAPAGVLTRISYQIDLEPKGAVNTAFMQQLARSVLASNLFALGRHIEHVSQQSARAPGFLARAMRESGPLPSGGERVASLERQPSQPRRLRSGASTTYLGMQAVPLPRALQRPLKVDLKASRTSSSPWQQAKEPAPAAKSAQDALMSWADITASMEAGPQQPESTDIGEMAQAMTQLHCRRMDTDEDIHRRVVASVYISASAEAVWSVLTDYDKLPELLPAMASCQRVPQRGAPPGVVRLRQVGQKLLPYMKLQAHAELDVVEKPIQEIQFRQTHGSFKMLQGKWMLQQPIGHDGIILKYAVEAAFPRNSMTLSMGNTWWEPLIERLIFEDLLTNLCSMKTSVEMLHARRQRETLSEVLADPGEGLRLRAERPRRQDMAKSFPLLRAELIRCFGEGGAQEMPTRAVLRATGRNDIERALEAHGGPHEVAKRMGWAPKRKPKGYWRSFENVEAALLDYIDEHPSARKGVMPSVAELNKAGQFGLAKAVEQFGGMAHVGAELGLEVKTRRGFKRKKETRKRANHGQSRPTTAWQAHVSEMARLTGSNLSRDPLFELASRTYKLPRSDILRIIEEEAGIKVPKEEQEQAVAAASRQGHSEQTRQEKRFSSRSEIDGW